MIYLVRLSDGKYYKFTFCNWNTGGYEFIKPEITNYFKESEDWYTGGHSKYGGIPATEAVKLKLTEPDKYELLDVTGD